jgi:hypothetical protein
MRRADGAATSGTASLNAPGMTSSVPWLQVLHLNAYRISGQSIRQFQVAPGAPDSSRRTQTAVYSTDLKAFVAAESPAKSKNCGPTASI